VLVAPPVHLIAPPRPGTTLVLGAWVPPLHRLVVVVAPTSAVSGARLYTLRPDGSDLRPLPVDRAGGRCRAPSEDDPAFLPPTRIVFRRTCFGREVSLLVYDIRRRTTTRYLRRTLPFFAFPFYSFSPTTGRGIVSLGDRLSNKLYRLSPAGLARLSVPLSNAGAPAWSPDGRHIAIDGVPASAGPDSATRVDTPYTLNVMDARGRHFHTLVEGLHDNAWAAWSPGGRRLSVVMTPPGGPHGVWLVDVPSRRRHLLLRGNRYLSTMWLPDGRLVVELRSGLEVVRP
jgi:WD40 repeat protein